jgi:nicotinamidase-related amidase
VFVRHDSAQPDSPLAVGQPGNDFKPELFGEPDLLVTKDVHSAFHGEPDLHGWLQAGGIDTVVVCGITTNHCCETTARVASDFGYETWFVRDATHTFDRGGIAAAELALITDVNLDGEFATVVGTSEMLEHVAWEAPADVPPAPL